MIILLNRPTSALAYGVEQIPCFILIDTNGTIVGCWSHLTPDATKEIKKLMVNNNIEVIGVAVN